jgi:predicted membrane channel-forming protein YqfA (hemolysin III family)
MDPSTENHVRLLSIFHYVLAGLVALFSLLPVAYVAFGVAMLSGALDDGRGNAPPRAVGWMVIALGAVMLLAGATYVALVAVAGRFLARRRHWTFCIVVAALSCTVFPFGTVLGVFTIIVLSKDEVKRAFEAGPGAPGMRPA